MHMGYYAARNAHQRMQELTFGTPPQYQTLREVPPMIAIALGADAVACHSSGGVESGNDVARRFFGDDVGFNSMFPAPFSFLPGQATNIYTSFC